MKKLILGCILIAAMGAASGALATNLLTNGDFETGDLTGWQAFGENPPLAVIAIDSPDNGPSFPGENHADLDNQAQAANLTLKGSSAAASVAPGATVYYLFDLRLGELADGGVFDIRLFAEQENGGVLFTEIPDLAGATTDWVTFEGTFLAPANTDFVTIQFSAITGAVENSISQLHVDNVYVGAQEPVAEEAMNWGAIKALYR